ncbi:MAG: NEW3 domain-containing protein [Acidimicrobiales bacterium]
MARGDGEADELDLAITVADRPIGGITLSTDFAGLRGRPGDTFRYDLQITNQTPDEITFAFDGRGPQGWSVTAGPASEQRASTVTVAAGDSESVRVEADPPANTAAGTYEIVVTANGGGQSGSFVLSAEITGRPSVELITTSGRLDLSGNAGDETETTVLVVNDGTAPLEEVRLSADEPADWTVTFEPDQIPLIGAGASEEVIVRITPSGDAVAGDYAIGVTARGEGETSEIAYRYTVATSRWWGAVGILIIVAALVLLLAVFRRFGRR